MASHKNGGRVMGLPPNAGGNYGVLPRPLQRKKARGPTRAVLGMGKLSSILSLGIDEQPGRDPHPRPLSSRDMQKCAQPSWLLSLKVSYRRGRPRGNHRVIQAQAAHQTKNRLASRGWPGHESGFNLFGHIQNSEGGEGSQEGQQIFGQAFGQQPPCSRLVIQPIGDPGPADHNDFVSE